MESGTTGVTGKKDATITKVDGVMDVDEADKKGGADAVSGKARLVNGVGLHRR